MKKSFTFGQDADIHDLTMISPTLFFVFAATVVFCDQKDIPLKVTSSIRQYDNISKSSTHQTGRALDLSVKNLTDEQIDSLIKFFDEYDVKFKVGAISAKTGKTRLVYRHGEHGDHLHIQVSK